MSGNDYHNHKIKEIINLQSDVFKKKFCEVYNENLKVLFNILPKSERKLEYVRTTLFNDELSVLHVENDNIYKSNCSRELTSNRTEFELLG